MASVRRRCCEQSPACIRRPAGNIDFDGKDVTALSAFERARRGIALVPQGRGIFPHLTVDENLTLGLSSLAGRNTAIRDNTAIYI